MEDIYNAARVIRPKSLAQNFSGIHPDDNVDDDDDGDDEEIVCDEWWWQFLISKYIPSNANTSLYMNISHQIYKEQIWTKSDLDENLSGTVREVLGTAQSVGCTVDGEDPHDLIEQIQVICTF